MNGVQTIWFKRDGEKENKSGILLYATRFRTAFSPIISTRGDLFVNNGGGEANNASKGFFL